MAIIYYLFIFRIIISDAFFSITTCSPFVDAVEDVEMSTTAYNAAEKFSLEACVVSGLQ